MYLTLFDSGYFYCEIGEMTELNWNLHTNVFEIKEDLFSPYIISENLYIEFWCHCDIWESGSVFYVKNTEIQG